MEIVSRITSKSVCGKIKAPEKATALYRIIGVCNGTREVHKPLPNGEVSDSVAFKGSFEATNYATGEIFTAGECFVPRAFEKLLAGQMNNLKEGESAQFAVEIGIKPSDRPIGYEYTVKPLVEPSQADALAGLRGQVPALPAPPHVAAAGAAIAGGKK